MAQLRQHYDEFVRRDAEILAVGPDSREAFQAFWAEHQMPFPGLADPQHDVARLYAQEVNLLKLGRMPAQFVIDRQGRVRYEHYSRSMSDIPSESELLAILDQLNAEEMDGQAQSTAR